MKGYKTLAFNGLLVVGGSLLTWASGVHWTDYVDATTAMVIVGVCNIVLRFLSNTPVLKSE